MIALRGRANERISLLRSMNLFSGCNKDQLRRIESLSMMMTMRRGTVLVEEGKPGREFFVVAEGTATASRHGLWLASFGPGSFFGELALLDGGERTATIVADTEMCLLVFSPAEFWSLQGLAPSVTHRMAVELGTRLRSTNGMLDDESSAETSLRPMVAFGASW